MKSTFIIFFALFISAYVLGQNRNNKTCTSKEYRQFDFWIGNWDVYDTLGNKIGENNILSLQNDCLIQENWQSKNETGTSYNFYDKTDQMWNQVWVDNTGFVIKLKGKYSNNKMVMRSEKVNGKSGKPYYNELNWLENKDGTILQTWFAVDKNGNKLRLIFKGIYKRKTKDKMNTKQGKVTGIGGIFFKSKDSKELKKWYSNNLGIVTDEYGTLFEFREVDKPETKAYLQWSPFSEKTEYFNPSKKDFMINYRVENIEYLVAQLKAAGVTVLDTLEEFDYGKFVHILDPENNKIELWEPVDKVFTESGNE